MSRGYQYQTQTSIYAWLIEHLIRIPFQHTRSWCDDVLQCCRLGKAYVSQAMNYAYLMKLEGAKIIKLLRFHPEILLKQTSDPDQKNVEG